MDGFQQNYTGRNYRGLVILLLCLVQAVPLLHGEPIPLQIDPSIPRAGKPFTVFFQMPLEIGSNTFQDSDFFLKEGFSFPPVFQVERGPDVRTLWTNVPGTEKAGLVMRIEYTLIVE